DRPSASCPTSPRFGTSPSPRGWKSNRSDDEDDPSPPRAPSRVEARRKPARPRDPTYHEERKPDRRPRGRAVHESEGHDDERGGSRAGARIEGVHGSGRTGHGGFRRQGDACQGP